MIRRGRQLRLNFGGGFNEGKGRGEEVLARGARDQSARTPGRRWLALDSWKKKIRARSKEKK